MDAVMFEKMVGEDSALRRLLEDASLPKLVMQGSLRYGGMPFQSAKFVTFSPAAMMADPEPPPALPPLRALNGAEEVVLVPIERWQEETRVEVEAVLRRARDLLSRGWISGSYAKDAGGLRVDPYDEAAVSFCSVGGLVRAAKDLSLDRRLRLALAALCQTAGVGHSITSYERRMLEVFNDSNQQPAVIDLFDRAIQRVRVEK